MVRLQFLDTAIYANRQRPGWKYAEVQDDLNPGTSHMIVDTFSLDVHAVMDSNRKPAYGKISR